MEMTSNLYTGKIFVRKFGKNPAWWRHVTSHDIIWHHFMEHVEKTADVSKKIKQIKVNSRSNSCSKVGNLGWNINYPKFTYWSQNYCYILFENPAINFVWSQNRTSNMDSRNVICCDIIWRQITPFNFMSRDVTSCDMQILLISV